MTKCGAEDARHAAGATSDRSVRRRHRDTHTATSTFRHFTMPVAPHNQILPGALVSIILQADQATGGQVQGTVREVLGNPSHQGIEVRLTDGRVGRVQEVLHDGTGPQRYFTQPQPHNSAVPNPGSWQAHTTYPGGHPSPQSPHGMRLEPPDPQNWQAHTGFPSGRLSPHRQQSQSPVPDQQNWQAHSNDPSGHPSPHRQQSHSPVPDPHNWQAHTAFPNSHSQPPAQQQQHPPPHPNYAHSRTSHTPLPDSGPQIPPGERSEQIEYLQSYESSKPQSEDDRNQATLQREFPNLDSSLIAAIYNDSKSLSATREMLQELRD